MLNKQKKNTCNNDNDKNSHAFLNNKWLIPWLFLLRFAGNLGNLNTCLSQVEPRRRGAQCILRNVFIWTLRGKYKRIAPM